MSRSTTRLASLVIGALALLAVSVFFGTTGIITLLSGVAIGAAIGFLLFKLRRVSSPRSSSGDEDRPRSSFSRRRLLGLGAVVVGVVVVAGLLTIGSLYLGYLPNPISGGPEMSFSGNETGNLVRVEVTGVEANTPLILRVDGAERARVTTNRSGSARTTLRLPSGEHRVTLVERGDGNPNSSRAGSGSVLLTSNITVLLPFNVNVGERERVLVTDESISLTATSSPVRVEPSVDGATVYVDGTETSPGMLNLSEGEHNVTIVRTDGDTEQVVSGTVAVNYTYTASIHTSATRDNVVWINGSAGGSSVTVEAVPVGDGDDSMVLARSKPANVSRFSERLALPVRNGTWQVRVTANGTTLVRETLVINSSITSFTVNGEPYEPGMSVSGDVELSGNVPTGLTAVTVKPGNEVTVENGSFIGFTVETRGLSPGVNRVVVTGERSGRTVFVVELNLTWSSGGQGSLRSVERAPERRVDSRSGIRSPGPATLRASDAAAP